MKGAQFPGRRITAGGVKKSQQCHKYFLPYSSLHSSERSQVRTGTKLATCPRFIFTKCNLVRAIAVATDTPRMSRFKSNAQFVTQTAL